MPWLRNLPSGEHRALSRAESSSSEQHNRFDVVNHTELPSRFARWEILARNLPSTSADDTLLDEAARVTAGVSCAQVREVAYLALQRAVLRTADVEDPVWLEQDDVVDAVARVAAKKEAGWGFHAGV